MSTEYVVPAKIGIERWLKRLSMVIAGILGAELIWLVGISPFMPLSEIEVNGISELDRAQILSQVGISSRSSYITVDVQAVQRSLESLYQVESALVIKRYPGTLRIVLTGRKPAAQTLLNLDSRVRPVVFDRQGTIIRIGEKGMDIDAGADIPIISGLVFDQVYLGMRLPVLFDPLLARLEWVNAASPELLAAVSEIRINRKEYDGFDLILYPVYQEVKFRVESGLDEDVLKYMVLIMDVFNRTGVQVDEVDLRSGAASYIEKEVSSD
ncbi:MAG: FtsQ-type POTRA domain-containing protein [Treponema sp.]|jgi:cell division protein FtsQ|nr:FtsQ-type POTRA domain-containing protein [Treponema sp.]